MSLKADRVKELVTAFADQRILVIGDLMLDRYIYGSVSRISPEAPVPVVQVSRETNMPGGASNVAWNIQALGGSSSVCGFVGRDQAGEDLCALLVQEGVSTEGAVAPDGVKTTVKTRIIAEHQQVVRVDWDDQSPVRSTDMDAFCERIHVMVQESTGVIIEDYGKGVIQQQVVDTVMAAAKEAGVPVGLDPKDNHDLEFKDLTVATPNRSEAYRAVGAVEGRPGTDPLCDQPLLEVGRTLQKKWTPELLLMTLGAHGMLLVSSEHPEYHIPTRAREVFDVSGAGDTVIAVSLLALASGASHQEAAELANYAAGIVVGKLGTAACSRDDLLSIFNDG